ncbi:hypothetical protein QTP88_019101 [Uroleucon formosanum]
MDQIFVTNTFDINSITDSSDINNLSGDDETFYFQIIEEDNETSDCNDSTSTINETIYSNDITSFSQVDIDNIISSIVEDKNQTEVKSQPDDVYDSEKLNSISPNKQESTENIDSMLQIETVDLSSSDSDEHTEQLGAKRTDPLVNLTAIRFINDRDTTYFTYYHEEIFTKLIKFLSGKTVNYVVNPFMKTTNGYKLHVKDLMTVLTTGTWLNDSIVQNYISLLIRHCDRTLELNTDFLNCYRLRGYDSVYKWFKNYDLNNFNRIVVPINPGKVHWCILVIELWKGKIYYFDSYLSTLIKDELTLSSEFLNRAIIDYIKHSGVKRTVPKKWEYINGKSPVQQNHHDCGVFTCMNARYFLLNKPPEYVQKDIPILRQIIAWELINNNLVL